jgi:hypothetical protein
LKRTYTAWEGCGLHDGETKERRQRLKLGFFFSLLFGSQGPEEVGGSTCKSIWNEARRLFLHDVAQKEHQRVLSLGGDLQAAALQHLEPSSGARIEIVVGGMHCHPTTREKTAVHVTLQVYSVCDTHASILLQIVELSTKIWFDFGTFAPP